jgi:hypothetical protein
MSAPNNDTNDIVLEIPSDMKIFDLEITSTNDSRSSFFNVGMQMISYGIQLFQLFLLILMTNNSGTFTLLCYSGQVVAGQAFIYWYLIFYCPSELSNYTKLRMQLAYQDKSKEYFHLTYNKKVYLNIYYIYL